MKSSALLLTMLLVPAFVGVDVAADRCREATLLEPDDDAVVTTERTVRWAAHFCGIGGLLVQLHGADGTVLAESSVAFFRCGGEGDLRGELRLREAYAGEAMLSVRAGDCFGGRVGDRAAFLLVAP